MKLLKYICFKSSADFETWQMENPDCKIHNITPLVSGIELKFETQEDKDSGNAHGTTNVSVFVIYFV